MVAYGIGLLISGMYIINKQQLEKMMNNRNDLGFALNRVLESREVNEMVMNNQ